MGLVHDQGCEAIGPVFAATHPAAFVETSVRGMEGIDNLGVSMCDFVTKFAVATDNDTCCVVLG